MNPPCFIQQIDVLSAHFLSLLLFLLFLVFGRFFLPISSCNRLDFDLMRTSLVF